MVSGERYTGEHRDGEDFAHADLSDCVFDGCSLIGCNFRAANLRGSQFLNCQFNNSEADQPADFSYALVQEALFSRCNLTVVEFVHCRGYAVMFEHCQMQGADLSTSDFRLPVGNSNLTELTISHCNLSYANLANNYLVNVNINNCRMLEVCMDYCDCSDATLQDNTLHNVSATGLTIRGADLRGSSFNNLNPAAIDLCGVKLHFSQLGYLADAMGVKVEADPD